MNSDFQPEHGITEKSRLNPRRRALKLILFLFLSLLSFSAKAETYKWTDDQGVVHVTDDPLKIPDKYWEQDRVIKEEVKPSASQPETKPATPAQPSQPSPATETQKIELYGDYPLEWWVLRFSNLRKDIYDTEGEIAGKKNFIDVFEGGRKFGKIFTAEEISRYNSYKADIPVLEEKLKGLKEELEELQRKAKISGVPKEITEQPSR